MPTVDLQFRLMGENIPVDHGYHLFSAISKTVPEIHENKDIAIHPINGRLIGSRTMALTDRSRLVLRQRSILGSREIGLLRASSSFNCQSTPRWVLVTSLDHAPICS